jgi:hypothetical protein
MEDLLKSIQIFLKYGNPRNPSHCEHDCFMIAIDPEIVTEEDKIALEELGFVPDFEFNSFISYRYGSC